MQFPNSRAIVAAALGVTLLLPVVSQAQTADPGADEADLEEIIVTARRRDESLQDVPISIVARTGDYLEEAGISSITELERVVPGFVFEEFEGGGQSTISIRGMSTFSQELASSQSVGLLVDDVVVDNVGQTIAQFNDIERIEVLRGPQGTLFGRNTTGGVVHIVTSDPIDEFEGKASFTYGSYDEVTWNGTVNIPIAETFAARASAFATSRDGYIENINDGQLLGSDDQAGARVKFLFTPQDGRRVTATAMYVERDQEGRGSGSGSPVVAFGPTTPQEDRDINAGIAGPENDKVNGRGSHPLSDRLWGVSLTWEESIGEFELKSITALEYWKWNFGEDALFRSFEDPIDPKFWHKFFLSFENTGWSQELRLASPAGKRLEYVVGAFVSGNDLTEVRDFLGNASSDPDLANAIFIYEKTVQDSDLLNYAIFGEADFHLLDTLTLTAGLRWTHDETDVISDATAAPGFIPELGIGFDEQGRLYIPILAAPFGLQESSVSANEWTWRAGLRWAPTEDLMVYGSAARGFKGPTVTALGPVGTVEPEFVTNYELGAKATLLDGHVTASFAVFHADVEDFQAEGTDIVEAGGEEVTFFRLTNAAEMRSRGAEFELSVAISDQMSFDLGLAYTDSEFESFPAASCFSDQTEAEGCVVDPETGIATQDLSGKPLPLVAPWSGNVAAIYDFALPFWDADSTVRLDYSYRDKINWTRGLAPRAESDAVGILGLSLSLGSQDDGYEVVGFIKNLADEYVVNGLTGGNGTITADLQPEYQRTWGITFNYRFP
jgi:iron complex outermembrane receptor protein